METRENLRNIAIIAHVDHGKTTLVDQMLRQSGIFRANETVSERVMDSGDLERERGITILSKNTAIAYGENKINIIDTPGHADFGGEVERILTMVDGVLLLVDAFEGVMPQTKFVLKKALGLRKKVVVVINKIDREGARAQEIIDQLIDLFIDLGVSDLDFPVLFASARDGYASLDEDARDGDMRPLLDAILRYIPAPSGDFAAPLQLLISNIDYDEYIGRLGIGRVERGRIHRGDSIALAQGEHSRKARVSKLYQFQGLGRVEVESAVLGDIVALSGIPDISIGDTLCDENHIEPLPFVKIDEPTISMEFMVNDSPFAGKEGKYVTTRNIRDRLYREIETNVSMRVHDTDSTDTFVVSGRGELHLSILIETMRREGYEFQVGRPKVIFDMREDGRYEPVEQLIIDVPEAFVGIVMEKLGARRAELLDMTPEAGGMRLIFKIPTRTLIGYRAEMLTDTQGNGVMSAVVMGYAPYAGEAGEQHHGAIITHESGETTTYGLFNAQERGRLFIGPGLPVYEGMVIGESAKKEDIIVNVCKKKHVTNMRASGSDEALRLVPHTVFSLEQCLEFLGDDELLEVTPANLRLRKRILAKETRMKMIKRADASA